MPLKTILLFGVVIGIWFFVPPAEKAVDCFIKTYQTKDVPIQRVVCE